MPTHKTSSSSIILPPLFREALSAAGMRAIDEWWAHLDDPARSEAIGLWRDCGHSESELAVRVEARLVDEQEDEGGDFWHSDYVDYLVNHEIYLSERPGLHICTQHPAARALIREGLIPRDFTCPFASVDCPMQKLLALSGGQALKLRVSLARNNLAPDVAGSA